MKSKRAEGKKPGIKAGAKSGAKAGTRLKQKAGNGSFQIPGTGTQWLKYGLAVLLVFVVGFALEYFCQVAVLRSPQRGVTELPLDGVSADGFERTDQGFLLTGDQGTLSIGLGGMYVDQFVYSFHY
ncbi:MAG: hypothetical protein Q4F76_05355, partial [Lachnospiraceae bacterium]|nr:hypothetical protein [Lachnospiraceae bacterium]